MATTWATLYLYLQQKVGKPYTGFLGPARANRLVRESLFLGADLRYRGLDTQKDYDELSVLIKTGKTHTPINNIISLLPASILSIGQSGGLSPTVTIVTRTPHWMITGSTATVAGVAGYVMASGSFDGNWVITRLSDTSFSYVATGAQVTSGAYTGTARTYNVAQTVLDYYHYFEGKAKYSKLLTPTITGITIAADAVITTNVRHNLRAEDQIVIASVTGTGVLPTNINGTQTVTEIISSTQFKIGVSTLTGTYTSGGTLSRDYYKWCVQYIDKIGVFGKPSLEYPRVEFTENAIKIYANETLLTETCTEFTINYMATPAVEPDMANTTLDLEFYYSKGFLYFLMDKAAELFTGQIKDQVRQQTEKMALRENP